MFFSVKNSIKIGGKTFRPCICYEVTPYLELTIKKLAEEGKVVLYNERVYFCNGKTLEKKVEDTCTECSANLGKGVCTGNSKNGMVDTTGELKCFEKKSKKAKKEEEEIPSPEEIADEGF